MSDCTASDILEAARQAMADRAAARDQPNGERSMGRAVLAFNVLHGDRVLAQSGKLTEAQGWAFMELVKHSRWVSGDLDTPDDHVDRAAFAALTGEAIARAAVRRAPDERG